MNRSQTLLLLGAATVLAALVAPLPAGAEPVATCGGKPATIIGTAGADVLKGTTGPDVIVGKGGNDVIRGQGGNDTICGGAGNDDIFGGAGDDKVYGQGGHDTLTGNKGNDTAFGGKGADKMVGGAGNDVMNGGAGNDESLGNGGGDIIRSHGGFDVADGGAGTDICKSDGELRLRCERGHRTFGSGTWVVPGEVNAGVYRNSSSAGGCYFARLSGFGGTIGEIIANQFTSEREIVQVSRGDAGFESNDCGTWSNNLTPRTASRTTDFGGGAFLVGYEIASGTWRNSDSSGGCYWERRSGFGGTLDDIISNGYSNSTQTVSIGQNDAAFFSEDCGTWTKIG